MSKISDELLREMDKNVVKLTKNFDNRLDEPTVLPARFPNLLVNGAIGGFDLMQIFALMGPSKVSIESTKAPRSLNGAPYLNGRELSETEEELVFCGGVQDAISGFPKNVNVAVATALASDNPETEVRIRSVPGRAENSHSITIEGEYMKAEIKVTSTPDPVNPKSSVSAAWSVVALLKNLASPVFFY